MLAIYAVLHDEQGTQSQYKHLYLKEDHWKLLEQLVVVLKPLQVATTALCESDYCVGFSGISSNKWSVKEASCN